MPTSASPPTHKGFDYASLDAETTQFVQQQTGEIRVLMKRTAQGIVEIGQKLIEVKQKLGHGRFRDWLEAEFEWTDETARRFVNVAQQFGNHPQLVAFAPSALYVLAAPSTSETARSEALARAEAGEPITYTAAKAIRQKYATPPTKPEPEPQMTSTPEPASKLEIVAIRPQGQVPVLEEATRLIVPQPSQPVYAPEQPGIWWRLGGQHLLYCGDPNSPEFLERVAEEKVSLVLAFPPTSDWQPAIQATTRIISTDALSQRKDFRLFEDALEAILLLCSDIGGAVVSCFLPSPEILSVTNRLDRRGLFAEPDSKRCNAVISDWKRAGLRAERLA